MLFRIKYKITAGNTIYNKTYEDRISAATLTTALYSLNNRTGILLRNIFIVDIIVLNSDGQCIQEFVELKDLLVFNELANPRFPSANAHLHQIWVPGPNNYIPGTKSPLLVVKRPEKKEEKKYKYKAEM